jgi:pimeloyl-ACP methyl ester carboxylesterase
VLLKQETASVARGQTFARYFRKIAAGLLMPALVLCLLTTDVSAREVGAGQASAVLRGVPITVYTYRPQGCESRGLLFVFHGNGRGASAYRDNARAFADEACLLVFAPLFDRDRFPNWRYHRGGLVDDGEVVPRQQWTVSYVKDLVDWARHRERLPDAPYYLFGHSAGGQFLSRVAAFALPADARRIVIANPSTYVLPLIEEAAPYGMGGIFNHEQSKEQLRRYLQLPITIYLGLEDTGDEDLTRNEEAMRQGENRLERGEYVFRLAHSIAEAEGWNFRWRLVRAPRVGHSSRDMLESDEALEAFGLAAAPQRDRTPALVQ